MGFWDMLGSLSVLDVATPMLGFAQDVWHGDVFNFAFTADQGINRHDIRRVAKQMGIPVWGLMFTPSNHIVFTVRKEHAQMMYEILNRNRVVMANPSPMEKTRSFWDYFK